MVATTRRCQLVMTVVVMTVMVGRLVMADTSDYCSITPKHTMCRPSGVAAECSQFTDRGVNGEDKKEILDYHNRLRAQVAGGETRQPGASNMMELQWDEELARLAQAHADNCKFRHDCSDCRRVRRFKVGQNLYQSFNTRKVGPNWRKAIDSWYTEIQQFPISSVQKYKFNHKTGHYSQLVWAKTTRVGCGSITYRSRKFNVRLYVCNYGEAGNIIRREVYSPGPACSHCPCGSTCSDQFPGLCTTRPTNNTNHDIMCMMPHMVHHLTDMTLNTVKMVENQMMDTLHHTGDMAMHTAHGVGHIAMDTVGHVGHVAMDTVHGVGHVAFNTVNTVNKGFSSLVNNGFNFAFSPFFQGNNNNLFRGKK